MGTVERDTAMQLKIGQWRGKIKKETYGVTHCERPGCCSELPDKYYQRSHIIPTDDALLYNIPPATCDQRWNLRFTCSSECNNAVEIHGMKAQLEYIEKNYPANYPKWEPTSVILEAVRLTYEKNTDFENVFWPPHPANEERFKFKAKKGKGFSHCNFYTAAVHLTYLYNACPHNTELLKESDVKKYAFDIPCIRCRLRADPGERLQRSHRLPVSFCTRELGLTSKILSDPRNIVPAHRNQKNGRNCNSACELTPFEILKELKEVYGIKEDELPTYVQPWLYQMWNKLWNRTPS
jgi:hypothetical protein